MKKPSGFYWQLFLLVEMSILVFLCLYIVMCLHRTFSIVRGGSYLDLNTSSPDWFETGRFRKVVPDLYSESVGNLTLS